MRRVRPDGAIELLPELDVAALTPDQVAYLRMMLGLASSGSMFHGRFVEAHLARLLNADLPSTGINAWDLRLPGPPAVTIEVKTTSTRQRYRLKRSAATVWIFVQCDDIAAHPQEFAYVVAPGAEVARLAEDMSVISTATLHRLFGPPVNQLDLLARVLAAAQSGTSG